MRFFIIVLSVFCYLIQSCSKNSTEGNGEIGFWTRIESGISETLFDVDFADDQNGWVVGDSGIILNTVDEGKSWKKQFSPTQEALVSIDFVDNNYGWICGTNSILRTTDSGITWEIKYTEDLEDGYFREIKFLDKNNGWTIGGRGLLGSTGVLLKTEDGGDTWQQASMNNLTTLTHISITNEQNIWICGFGGTVLSSVDVGQTWKKQKLSISPSPSLTTIQFMDSFHGWVSSRDDYLGFYITNDGGESWVRISETSFMIIGGVLSFHFIDKNVGWMCNFPFDRILKTTDSGLSWEYDSEIRQRINSFKFIGNETGWAVGDHGSILKYSINNIR